MAGNGQRELAEVIAGLRKVDSGTIAVFGETVTNCKPSAMIARGVSYVPEDRLGVGLAPNLSIIDNLLLKSYRQPECSGRWLLRQQHNEAKAVKLVKQYKVKLASLHQPVRLLSGGNLQKLLLAREIAQRPRLMVVVYPARGLDVGATEAVHKLLLSLRAAGTAILLISEDLEEIIKNLVQIGDTKVEVLSRCGEPALREKIRRGASARKGKAKSGSTAEERYREDEQWTYNLGPRDFHYTLTFEGMELKAIGRGGRGTRR